MQGTADLTGRCFPTRRPRFRGHASRPRSVPMSPTGSPKWHGGNPWGPRRCPRPQLPDPPPARHRSRLQGRRPIVRRTSSIVMRLPDGVPPAATDAAATRAVHTGKPSGSIRSYLCCATPWPVSLPTRRRLTSSPRRRRRQACQSLRGQLSSDRPHRQQLCPLRHPSDSHFSAVPDAGAGGPPALGLVIPQPGP
jgi:hypothetical protein